LTTIGSYQVKVLIESNTEEVAFISPATIDDMPTNWSCNWLNICNETAFYCQNIVKLVYRNKIWGLIKYSLYPYTYPDLNPPIYLEINNLEAHPTSRGDVATRLIEPIGKWLIWYATKVAFKFCQVTPVESFVWLESLDKAVPYYRDREAFLDFAITEALKNNTLQPYTTEMSETAHGLVKGVELDDQ
jgi:hypothetical protein